MHGAESRALPWASGSVPSSTLSEFLMSKTNYLYAYITALPHDLSPVWGHDDLPKGRSRLSLLSLSY